MREVRWNIVARNLGVFLLVVVGGLGLFIKFDTGAAAEFTDNYLRPLLGPEVVVGMEKYYYNLTDKIQQVTYNPKAGTLVHFLDQGNAANLPGNRLNLKSIAITNFSPLPEEGVWKNRPLKLFPNQEVMAYTFVRPDPARPYATTTLVQIDTKAIHVSAVAGTTQPAGPVGMPGPGKVPTNIDQGGNLIAAFDGGFQYRDGQYGMIVDGTTYLPLKNNLGTLVGYKDGSLKIINYTGQDLGKNVEFVRQNCPILVQDGQVAVTSPKNKAMWGRTLSSGIYTWRSGVGITNEGNLIYAVGNNLTPETLAAALQAGGATNAIQLDINPYWVRFNIFDTNGQGGYTTSTLIKELQDGSKQYMNGYSKDFFYLYKN
jgi:hypothetical protein